MNPKCQFSPGGVAITTRVSCVRAFHTRTCESKALLATKQPSALAARDTTPRVWPTGLCGVRVRVCCVLGFGFRVGFGV